MKWRAAGAILCGAFAVEGASGAAANKRALRDYGNGGKELTTFGDVAIWVPRIVLSPVYLVTEYGIRWPLGHLIAEAERRIVAALLVEKRLAIGT